MTTMFADVPAVREGLVVEPCALVVENIVDTTDATEAWAALPATGKGIVMLTDAIRRYDPSNRSGRLLLAEVADGDKTWVVRLIGSHYKGWLWTESTGDTHCVVRQTYLSSEPAEGEPDLQQHAHYWKLADDDGLKVYKPCGSRFVGFVTREGR